MSNAYLIPGLRKGPLIVKWIVEHAPEDIYDTKTYPDRFTFREVVAHMVDWEPITLGRMRQAVKSPGSTLVAYDELQRAVDFKYRDTDPRIEMKLWISLREATIKFLEEDAPGHWESTVTHPERGPQTLYDLANLELGHDTYHVEQLLEFMP